MAIMGCSLDLGSLSLAARPAGLPGTLPIASYEPTDSCGSPRATAETWM
jgi:hypothetical protein